jgi:hypothetical protein
MAMVQVGEIVRRPGKLETEILIEPFGQSKVARRDEGLGLYGCPAARVSNPGCFHRKQASTYHELVNKKGTKSRIIRPRGCLVTLNLRLYSIIHCIL